MRRKPPGPYASDGWQIHHLVVWTMHWQVIESVCFAAGADLRAAMTATIARLAVAGWEAESDAAHGFVFIHRQGQRRLLGLTARDPLSTRRHCFNPFTD